MQAVCGGVKADIEYGLAVVDKVTDELFIGNLGNQASGLEFFVNTHVFSS